MYNIFDQSVITVYQGNALLLEITLTDCDSGEPIPVENDDYILLTIVNKRGETVIQKRLTSADYDTEEHVLHCKIDPADTIDLPTGEYCYDCLYVCGQDTPSTFASGAFIVVRAYGKIPITESDSDPDTQGGV